MLRFKRPKIEALKPDSHRDRIAALVSPWLLSDLIPIVMEYLGIGQLVQIWDLGPRDCHANEHWPEEEVLCHHDVDIETIAWTGDALCITLVDNVQSGELCDYLILLKDWNTRGEHISIDPFADDIRACNNMVYLTTRREEIILITEMGTEITRTEPGKNKCLAVDSKAVVSLDKEGELVFLSPYTLEFYHGLGSDVSDVSELFLTSEKLFISELSNQNSQILVSNRWTGNVLNKWSLNCVVRALTVIENEIFLVESTCWQEVRGYSITGELMHLWSVGFEIVSMCTDNKRLYVAGSKQVQVFL